MRIGRPLANTSCHAISLAVLMACKHFICIQCAVLYGSPSVVASLSSRSLMLGLPILTGDMVHVYIDT